MEAEFDPMAGGHPVPPMPGPAAAGADRGRRRRPGRGTRAEGTTDGGDRVTDLLTQLKGFGVTFGTMFKKVVTEQYPDEKKPTEPRFHGRHQLNRHPDGLEKCIGCELCAWACPADAIYVEGADNTDGERFSPGRALRPRLPDQLPALHLLRAVHRGLPDPRAHDDQRVRAGRRHPGQAHLREAGPARPRCCRAWCAAPHPMVEGADDKDYYQGKVTRATRRRSSTPPARTAGDGRGRRDRLRRSCSPRPPTPAPARPSRSGSSAPVAVLAALGVLVRQEGGALGARCSPRRCSRLAVLYLAQDAPFLGVVQVVVYTGAVMMLFLFVLMLVGVDSADSLVETLRGQRIAAVVAALGFGGAARSSAWATRSCDQRRASTEANAGRQRRRAWRNLIFCRYVFAFEVTSALLITAAMGAMVLAHRERHEAQATQRELSGAAVPRRPAPGPAARPRRLRPAQRRRHPGPAARRLAAPRCRCRAVLRRARRRPTGVPARPSTPSSRRGRPHRGGRAP